ncbi:MAG: SDR family NAD(P)-dependent oxidoreductase [Planctomycetota bacterium]
MSRPPTDENMGKHPPIAIVGLSCLFPNAPGLKEYWRLIRRGEDAITDVPETHWSLADYFDADLKAPDRTYCRRGAFLEPTPFNPMEFGIPPTTLEATDTAQLLGLVVGKKALQDAGYGLEREFDRTRASVIFGVTGTQELVLPLGARLGFPIWQRALNDAGVAPDVAAKVLKQISDSYVGWQEGSFPGLLGNVVAGRVANRLNLRGTNCVVDAACASSLSAIHLSIMELVSGRADMVLTGGVDTLNDIFMFMCFSKSQALSAKGDARPFSKHADGTVIGEGVGMLVLKRLADAQRDGDRIHAVIKGIGTSSDGRAQSIYAPLADGQAIALRDAYRISNVEPASIELVEAHGTGTKVGDLIEFEALKSVYNESERQKPWCALGSVKAQIGHTKAAAGAASMIKTVLALRHKVLPATIKVDEPHPKLGIEDSPFYLATEMRPWLASPEHPRRAAVSSFGFGGSNFHAVLEEYPTDDPQPAWDGSVEIIALSASTAAELEQRLEEWQAAASEGLVAAELARRASQSRSTFHATDSYRLALVHERDKDLTKLLKTARDGLSKISTQQAWNLGNVFFGGPSEPGEIAFLFPGQSSQYVGMCRDVVCMFPEAHDAVATVDPAVAAKIYPPPVFGEQERARQQAALTSTDVAQPALGAVSLAMLRVLERFGIKPHFVAGHSFGELVALHAAGCIDEDALCKLAQLRGQLLAEAGGADGTMLAVNAPLEEIDRVLEEGDFDVEFANRNGPTQGILSGSRAAIARVAEFLDGKGWRTRLLEVSAAFHSRFMNEAQGRFRAALDKIPFAHAKIPVFANSTGQPYPLSPSGMRDLLADQLTRPVLFVDEIRHLYDAGVRTFVEVGPKKVLTGLVNGILQGKPYEALAVDATFGRASGIVDVARVVALITIMGHAVDLTQWEQTPPAPEASGMSIALLGTNYRMPHPAVPAASQSDMVAERETGKLAMHDVDSRTGGRTVPHGPDKIEQPGVPRSPDLISTAADTRPGPSSKPTPTPSPTVAGSPAQTQQMLQAFQIVQEGLRGMQALQQQTAAAHQRFLEGQQQAHSTIEALMANHQRLVERTLGLTPSTSAPVSGLPVQHPVAPTVGPSAVPEPVAITVPAPPLGESLEVRPPIPIAPANAPITPPAGQALTTEPGGNGESGPLASALLQTVSETTGFPLSTIHLDMDLESDLGIDRVRRVEILTALRARVPDLPKELGAHADRFRTLREIVEFKSGQTGTPTAADASQETSTDDSAVAGTSRSDFEQVVLEVVSELTGYPAEMLELDMDMEADLGIDSIKRLEILSAVQRRLPELGTVDSQYMGSLRTLRNILDYMDSPAEQPPPATEPAPARNSAPSSEIASESTTLERRELRTIDLPAVESARPVVAAEHEIWVTNDGTELAATLVARMAASGIPARVIEPATAITETRDVPVGGLILLAPTNASQTDLVTESSRQFLKQAFLLTRMLASDLQAAAANGGALLVTVSRLDGSGGLTGASFDAVGGGLAGLAKTAAHEWPTVCCRSLDVDADWSDLDGMCNAISNELGTDGPVEVGLSATGRRGLELVIEPPAPGELPLAAGDVVVITGGARGVTAETALALAESQRLTLVLLGRSPIPKAEPAWSVDLESESALKRALLENTSNGKKLTPNELESTYQRLMANREISRNLERISATGAKVLYRQVDVRQADELKNVFEEVRQVAGPIRGLVHGAGVIEDHLIADKTTDAFDRVFDTKVQGLAGLLAATAHDDLKVLALFSSVSGRFGRQGQADYAMANEVLNKVAQRLAVQRPECRVVSINWGAWDGGMVTPTLKREFMRQGVGLIPLKAGAQALVDELRTSPRGAVEVMIGVPFDVPPEQPTRKNATTRTVGNGDMSLAFERRLDIDRHTFLNSHVISGHPVLPVVIMLEWLGHGALHGNPGLLLHGFDELRVLKGVVLTNGPRDLRVVTSRARRHGEQYELDVELRSGDKSQETLHARARAVLTDNLPDSPTFEQRAEVELEPYPRDIAAAYREVLFHGPDFHGIERVLGHSKRGISGVVRPAAAPTDWMSEPPRTEWLGDPLVLDAGLQLGLLWCHEHLGGIGLPCCVGRYSQYRSAFPREELTAVLEVVEQDPQRLVADITFTDSGGQVVARMERSEWIVNPSLGEMAQRGSATGA